MPFRAPVSFVVQLAPASKRITRAPGGALRKEPPTFTSALVAPRLVDAEALAELIAGRYPRTYLKWAVPAAVGMRKAWALTARDAALDRDGALAALAAANPRSAAAGLPSIGLGAFVRPAGAGWLPVDVDPGPGRSFTRARALELLAAAAPGIEHAPRVVFDSSSGWLAQVGGPLLVGQAGLRLAIGVRSAGDIERAGQALFGRLWLAGAGWCVITDSGRVEPRTLVDLAVTRNAAQPDFFQPGILGEGLEYRAPAPEYSAGSGDAGEQGFDTAILVPDLTPAEHRAVQALQRAAAAALEPEATQVRERYLQAKAEQAAARRGTDVEAERRRLGAVLSASGQVIAVDADTQVCTRRFGWLTMAEIGARGLAAFEGDPYCADLAEPEYRSNDGRPTTSKAAVKRAGPGLVVIKSYAHAAGTRYVWADGVDPAGVEFDDGPEAFAEPDAHDTPAPWAGSGQGASTWDAEAAAMRSAEDTVEQLEAALAAPGQMEFDRILEVLRTGGIARHLHHGLEPDESDRKLARLTEDLAAHCAQADGPVSLVRRGQTNSLLVHYRRADGAPEPFTHPDQAVPALQAALAPAEPLVSVVVGTSVLPAGLEAITLTAQAGTRVEVSLPNTATRAAFAEALRARGLIVAERPSRLGLDSTGTPLCAKAAAIRVQVAAGVTEGFFSSHCRVQVAAGAFEFCPEFASCGYNREARACDLADVVVSGPAALGVAPNQILEKAPARALAAFADLGTAESLSWPPARITEGDCGTVRGLVEPVLDAVRAGVPVAGWRELLTRNELALLGVESRAPRVVRPRFTPAAAERRCREAFAGVGSPPPWAIASAVLRAVQGEGALAWDERNSRFSFVGEPGFDRLGTADAVLAVQTSPLTGRTKDRLARALGGSKPSPSLTLRLPPSVVPGTIVLSRYPRARQRELLEPEMVAALAAGLATAQAAGARVLLVAHAVALKDAIWTALAALGCVREGLEVITPNERPARPSEADLIVATAVDRIAQAGQARQAWLRAGSAQEFADAMAARYALRLHPPTLWRPGERVVGLIQPEPADDEAAAQLQAMAYATVEAAAIASHAAGRHPVLILLDTVAPPWPVHAVLPRDLLLPPGRARLVVQALAGDPTASYRELARGLAESHPTEFGSEAAAWQTVRDLLAGPGRAALLATRALWSGVAPADLESVARAVEEAEFAEDSATGLPGPETP